LSPIKRKSGQFTTFDIMSISNFLTLDLKLMISWEFASGTRTVCLLYTRTEM